MVFRNAAATVQCIGSHIGQACRERNRRSRGQLGKHVIAQIRNAFINHNGGDGFAVLFGIGRCAPLAAVAHLAIGAVDLAQLQNAVIVHRPRGVIQRAAVNDFCRRFGGFAAHLHGKRIGECIRCIVRGIHIRVAALHGDGGAIGHRNVRHALVLGIAHERAHLVVLVGRRGSHLHRCGALRHGQRVGALGRTELLIQRAGGKLDGGKRLVRVVPVRAQVGTVSGARVHHADLVAGGQLAVGYGERIEGLIGEPVVQRAHPAGLLAAVEFAQTRNASHVSGVLHLVGLAGRRDSCLHAAHHGGVGGKRHRGVHELARPGGRLVVHRRGERGVLHGHVHASQISRSGLVGYGRGRQHRQQTRRKHERQEDVQRAAHAFLLFLHFPSFRFLVTCFPAPRLCGARPLCVPVVSRTPLRTPFMQRAFARATLLRCARSPHRKETENASGPGMGSLAFLRNRVRFAAWRLAGFAALLSRPACLHVLQPLFCLAACLHALPDNFAPLCLAASLRLNCSRVVVVTLANPRCWRFSPTPTATEVRLIRSPFPH